MSWQKVSQYLKKTQQSKNNGVFRGKIVESEGLR
jgi:hypothetical protein